MGKTGKIAIFVKLKMNPYSTTKIELSSRLEDFVGMHTAELATQTEAARPITGH
jgi:hypothetical protein